MIKLTVNRSYNPAQLGIHTPLELDLAWSLEPGNPGPGTSTNVAYRPPLAQSSVQVVHQRLDIVQMVWLVNRYTNQLQAIVVALSPSPGDRDTSY